MLHAVLCQLLIGTGIVCQHQLRICKHCMQLHVPEAFKAFAQLSDELVLVCQALILLLQDSMERAGRVLLKQVEGYAMLCKIIS